MKTLQSWLLIGIYLGISSSALADEEEKTVVAAKAATLSASDLVSSFTTASFFNPIGLFRIQLGDTDKQRGASASDDSEFETVSFSITPTVAAIDNDVEPILVDGDISLVILGIESFNELDMVAKGITLTLDQTSVTSTEVASGASNTSSSVSGNGWTIAPYYVVQLDGGELLDINIGVGKNNLDTSSSGVTASPESKRAFASIGLSTTEAVSEGVYVQYKGALSYTRDEVAAYTQSDATSVAKSTTELTQIRIGSTISKQFDGVVPFVSGTLIGNEFRAAGGSGNKPKEHSFTTLIKTGLNFSTNMVYGSLAFQTERDKSSTQFYVGYRF